MLRQYNDLPSKIRKNVFTPTCCKMNFTCPEQLTTLLYDTQPYYQIHYIVVTFEKDKIV